ncbi:putative E3 ubiquitin-protein ligase TTC3 [Penaeus vannamei]|uniref:Putative E3 ubiquitin-protein ligase TTC3 n=1 Tax=Penaeus vannamei TaxID=6689 RepID=A0A3R7MIE6_PENVA|nr:putative E3 ubiquitin-protein ligase TTC3 [Penaeus vannamei]
METEAQAGTTQGKLTQYGIQKLYSINPDQQQITVQVVFFAFHGTRYYLRLADGEELSPIVLMEKSVYGSDFGLGDVIVIKQRACHPDDKPEWEKGLEDNDFWHIYITEYTVSDHFSTVRRVIGTYDEIAQSYRESVKSIRHFLEDKSYNMNVNALVSVTPIKVEVIGKASRFSRDIANLSHYLLDYKSAVKEYSKAIRHDLYNSTSWSNCSQTFLRTRDYADAEQFAIIALKFNPFHEKSYIRLVQSALAQGNVPQAHHYARAAKFMCRANKPARAFLKKAFARFDELSTVAFIQPFPVRTLGKIYSFLYSSSKIKLTYEGKRVTLDKDARISEVANEEWELEVMPLDRKRREQNIKRRNQQQKSRENVRIKIQKEQESRRELEERLQQRELSMMKKMNVEVKSKTKKKPTSQEIFLETCENGRRFFEEHHYRQAVMAFEKSMEEHLRKQKGDLKEIHFAAALCEIQSGRGYITDGMDILKVLACDPEFAPAANYWLAVSHEKICMFKRAGTYAESCLNQLKENGDYKGNMWPGTSEIIPETTPAYLAKGSKEVRERVTSSVPAPKAKCHLSNCCSVQGHDFAKQEIYLQDLEFKGYINVTCEEDCIISFHHVCWKSLKEQDKNAKKKDKDFLGTECLTPDCSGLIHSITIYDKTREKKKERQGGASKEASGLEQTLQLNDTDTAQEMESTVPEAPALPIDPESLEWTNVTVLKPSAEEEQTDKPKSIKKKKKKKKKKATPQADLLGDPLDASENVENEYVARLKLLKQEKEEKMMSNAELRKLKRARALQERKDSRNDASDNVGELLSECQPVQPIDPNNPFFIPKDLRKDNVKFEQFLKGEKFGGKTLKDPLLKPVVPCYDGDININIQSGLQEAGRKNRTESTSSSDSFEDPVTEIESGACADPRAEVLDLLGSDVDVDVTCSICLEPYDDFVSETLDCGHRFHHKCIRYWLKQQSNCPNCRKFALTEEDYPSLLDARKWLSL